MKYKIGDKVKYTNYKYIPAGWCELNPHYLNQILTIEDIHGEGKIIVRIPNANRGYVHSSWIAPANSWVNIRKTIRRK